MLAGPHHQLPDLVVVSALQMPFQHHRRHARPHPRLLQVGTGRKRSSDAGGVPDRREAKRPAKRRPLECQYPPLLGGAIGGHGLEGSPEPVYSSERLAAGRDQGEAEDAAIGMRRTHKGHRYDSQVGPECGSAIRTVTADDFGNLARAARLRVARHQRLAQDARNESHRPDIRDIALDRLEHEPTRLRVVLGSLLRTNRGARPDHWALWPVSMRFLQLTQTPWIDAPPGGHRLLVETAGIGSPEPATGQTRRVTNVANAARDPVERVQHCLFRPCRPNERDNRIVRASHRKAARLSATPVRQHSQVLLRRLRPLGIIRWHEHVGCRSRAERAGTNLRRRLLFQPLKSKSLLGPFTPHCPRGNEGREHAIRLRRPVRPSVARFAGGPANAGQELDLKNEAHSSISPPSPSSASSRLRRTISTSFSCGSSVSDRNRKPAFSAPS